MAVNIMDYCDDLALPISPYHCVKLISIAFEEVGHKISGVHGEKLDWQCKKAGIF